MPSYIADEPGFWPDPRDWGLCFWLGAFDLVMLGILVWEAWGRR